MASGPFVQSSRSSLSPELHLLLAHLQVTVVDHFRNDVAAILQLEIDQVGLSILDLIDGGLFTGFAVDVGEGIVVEDGCDLEWLLVLVAILELQRRGILRPVLVDLVLGRFWQLRSGSWRSVPQGLRPGPCSEPALRLEQTAGLAKTEH